MVRSNVQNHDAIVNFNFNCQCIFRSLKENKNVFFSGSYFGFYAPQALAAQQLTAAGKDDA